VIAVIGIPRLRGEDTDADVAGLAASIATAAAAADSRVELVGKVGDDAAGDAVLLALGRHGVGHVATLRDPVRATPVAGAVDDDPDDQAPTGSAAGPAPVLDAGDVGLALRYLPELGVIVTVHVGDDVVDEAASAAGWARTTLIVVVEPGAAPPEDLPPDALVVAAEELGELGGAGAAIGRYAAALDQGAPADAAYAELVAAGEAPSSASA
jgi:sugar/nucleoside kinase (ribokinase family)